MATRSENLRLLKVRRDAVIAELATLTAPGGGGGAGSLPNATGPGVNIDHQSYKKGLYEELDQLNAQITALDVGIVRSYGV